MASTKALHRADTRALADLALTKGRYGFGCSWTNSSGRTIDIDLQCVVVDQAGSIIDCAYYNNLKAASGSITHSGDETGRRGGIEEAVWVHMRKLPSNVSLLIFVAAAYSGGKLKDINNGCIHIFEENEHNEMTQFQMKRCDASVDIMAAMFRADDGSWKVRGLDQAAEDGHHFMDILPSLCKTVRKFIPHAPQRQKVAFAMEKGGVMDLPMSMNSITVGLGWDVDEGEVDLDVSAVLLDADGQDLEAVFFGRLESDKHGVRHTGDNLTGEGDGDDEQIEVDLDNVGEEVQQIFFVVNIYSPGKTFQRVANPYCRVVDNAAEAELCRYSLRDAGRENGLIISRIVREPDGRWGFHALGLPCRGRTYKDSMAKVRQVSQMKTATLMLRRSPSMATSMTTVTPCGINLESAPAPTPVVPLPMTPVGGSSQQQACCIVM